MNMAAIAKAGMALVLSSCATTPAPVDHRAVAARSAPVAAEFSAPLQQQLRTAMENGGPLAALTVCQQVAPAIAQIQSQASKAEVRRVARRNRNPAAMVSEALRPHYEALEQAPMKDGRPATQIWRSGAGDEARINYLSAIPMQEEPCAACHGTAVPSDVVARIRELYPQDSGTGFSPGELRGALLISWPANTFGP
jgi:FtsP/CotA-like multicopper oxidase with cupredoxin domain